jgi:hypothetical protein
VVQEPPQPKIKLKMAPGQETPVVASKKITIHVGGSRGSTAASPAPQTSQPSDSGRPDAATDGSRGLVPAAAATTGGGFQLDNIRPLPTSVASPSPSVAGVAPGIVPPQPSAAFSRPNGTMPGAVNVPQGMLAPGQNTQQPPPAHPHLNGHSVPAPAPAPVSPIWDYKYRAPGRGRSSPCPSASAYC